MKKISTITAAVSALMLAACGGQTAQSDETSDSNYVSELFEQSRIESIVMAELDSVAVEWSRLTPVEGVFSNGKIKLSEDEIKVKPNYLFAPASIDELTTFSQKYRAIAVLVVDKKVAEHYKMDVKAYEAAIAKLVADVNDPTLKSLDGATADGVKDVYEKEKENGRINFFWEASAAGIVENLYIMSQNAAKIIPAFDDDAASNLTYHIGVLKIALDDLSFYDENIKGIAQVLSPLNELNAVSVDQLKEQIAVMKPQIEAARASLLK